jgi:hypothetical protein
MDNFNYESYMRDNPLLKEDQSPKKQIVAKDKAEWWRLVRQDLNNWNAKSHPDDQMDIQDWIGEVGPKIHGWIAFRDRDGDWDASLTGYEDDEEEYDDDY